MGERWKTNVYFLRTRPAQAIQFTVDQSVLNDSDAKKQQAAGAVRSTASRPADATGILSPNPFVGLTMIASAAMVTSTSAPVKAEETSI